MNELRVFGWLRRLFGRGRACASVEVAADRRGYAGLPAIDVDLAGVVVRRGPTVFVSPLDHTVRRLQRMESEEIEVRASVAGEEPVGAGRVSVHRYNRGRPLVVLETHGLQPDVAKAVEGRVVNQLSGEIAQSRARVMTRVELGGYAVLVPRRTREIAGVPDDLHAWPDGGVEGPRVA